MCPSSKVVSYTRETLLDKDSMFIDIDDSSSRFREYEYFIKPRDMIISQIRRCLTVFALYNLQLFYSSPFWTAGYV